MTILLFLVLLVATFVVVLATTRQTKEETHIGRRLAGYNSGSTSDQVVDTDILKREVYSELPLINALLSRLKVTSNLDTLLKQANLNWTVGGLMFSSLGIGILAGVLSGMYCHVLTIGAGIGVAASICPYLYVVLKRGARLKKFEANLPDAIDLMARALRAGHAVTAAIEMVAREVSDPVGMEFRRVFEEQNFGLPLREALQNLANRVPLPDLRFMVTARCTKSK